MPPRARIASLAPSRREVDQRAGHHDGQALEGALGGLVTLVLHGDAGGAPLVDDLRGASRPANHSMTASAMVGPTPSAAASSSRVGASDRSIEPNSVASARAAVGPTCRIDSATSTRHSGTCLRPARLASRRSPLAAQLAALLALLGRPGEQVASSAALARSRSKMSPSSVTTPASSRACAASEPSPSMSNAPRPATWKTRSQQLGRALLGGWGSGGPCRPPSAAPASVPHDGHAVGITHSAQALRSQPQHRPDDLGDHVAGLAQHHGVAGPDVLALDLVGVVQGRPLDGRAGHLGRLHHPERRDPAGAPDVDLDREQLGVDLLGRVLERDRPARRPDVEPSRRCSATSSTLTTTPSISCSTRVPVLAVVVDELADLRQEPRHPHPVAGRQPPGLQGGVRLGLRASARSPRARRCRGTPCRASRVAVTRGSFCRSDPAAALRGLANDRLAGLDQRLVEPLERLDREEHLAAHLDQARAPGTRSLAGQPVRDRVDRS